MRSVDDMNMTYDVPRKRLGRIDTDLNEMPPGMDIFDQASDPFDMPYKAPTTTGYPGDTPRD